MSQIKERIPGVYSKADLLTVQSRMLRFWMQRQKWTLADLRDNPQAQIDHKMMNIAKANYDMLLNERSSTITGQEFNAITIRASVIRDFGNVRI